MKVLSTDPCAAWLTVPQESTAQLLSFEWSHQRISSTDSKAKITLYSLINSITENYWLVAFINIWMVISRISSRDSKLRRNFSTWNFTLAMRKVYNLFLVGFVLFRLHIMVNRPWRQRYSLKLMRAQQLKSSGWAKMLRKLTPRTPQVPKKKAYPVIMALTIPKSVLDVDWSGISWNK